MSKAIRCAAADQRLTARPAGGAAVPRHVGRLRAEDGCGGLGQVLPDARTHHLQTERKIRHDIFKSILCTFTGLDMAAMRPCSAALHVHPAHRHKSTQMRPILCNAVAGSGAQSPQRGRNSRCCGHSDASLAFERTSGELSRARSPLQHVCGTCSPCNAGWGGHARALLSFEASVCHRQHNCGCYCTRDAVLSCIRCCS